MSFPAITELIPHRPPMVLVDSVRKFDDNSIETSLLIRDELMFAQARGLPSWTAIEIMAQSISAYAGLKGRQRGEPPQIGYLLGSRRLQLPIEFFAPGKTLVIRASEHYMHEGLGQFHCEIDYDGHTIAAVLNVYQPESAHSESAKG